MDSFKCKKIKKKLITFKDTRVDDYYWLKNKKNPKVIEVLENENNNADRALRKISKLKKQLFKEMKGRLKEDDETYPIDLGPFLYKTSNVKGKNYLRHILIDHKTKKEKIVLDENKLSQGYDYFELVGPEISFDGKYLIYGIDTKGEELYDLKIRSIETLEDFNLTIEKTCGDFEWGKQGEIYYVLPNKSQRPCKVLKIDNFLDEKFKPQTIFYENDDKFWVSLSLSMSEEFLFINSGAIETNEIRFINLNENKFTPKIVRKRKKGIDYTVDHAIVDGKNYFVENTNQNAIDYKLNLIPLSEDKKSLNFNKIVTFLNERPGSLIENYLVLKDYLILEIRENANSQLQFISWNDIFKKRIKIHTVYFEEEVYEVGISDSNIHFETDVLRLNYSSLKTPNSVLEYSFKTHKFKLLKTMEIKGHNSKDYITEKIFVKGHDKTLIPVSLVYKKGLKKNGKNPCLLYGYGAYGAPTTTSFSSRNISILERGYIMAIAHVRGSSDCGKRWYYAGKLLKKKNTFLDFISVADYLIHKKYTKEKLISAMGGSAGGMLIGAVLNMRPELFLSLTALVPFVDVLTTMLDDSLLLTKTEYDEWGNPNIKKYYDYIKSYSPYDNIKAGNYPHLFVRAGLNDPRVTYWEPLKWVMKLKDHRQNCNDLFIKTNMSGGHFGDSGRFQVLKEFSEEIAFLIYHTENELKRLNQKEAKK